jgi:choline-sulfatase
MAGTLGYSALFAWPALAVLGAIARGLWAAWRVDRLRAALVDEHGSAPRRAGWLGFTLLACFVLSWATFNTIRLLAGMTTFKPTVVALAAPGFVVAAALVIAVASRPTVDGLAWIATRLDRRCRARWNRSPFTPRVLLAATVVGLVALAVVAWFVSVAPRVGYLDLGIFVHPLVAIGVGFAAHHGLRRAPARARRAAMGAAAGLLAAAIGVAVWMRGTQPLGVLQIWGRPTVASEVIEQLYYLEDLRSDIALLVRPPVPRAGAEPRDIVLVTIDTVRADRTPLLGARSDMPHLGELGERGANFVAAYSPGNVTRRSIPAIATGVSPTRVRGKVAGWALRLDPRHILLAERFRAAGYDTAGFFCCASFWAARHRLGINRGIDHLVIEPDGGKLAEQVKAWIAQRRATSTKPLFLWVHFLEPHNWTQGRTDLRTAADKKAQYDRVLTEVDGYLNTVLVGFAGAPRQPIVAVTADHGEALGDHGRPNHSTDLYDSQIHVPLVIVGPGVPAHKVVEPVGLTSLAPTLLDLAGFVPPGMPEMDGTSFAALATGTGGGDPDGGYAFAAMIKDRSTPDGMRAVIKGTWKLIDAPRGLELYDRRTDVGEMKNLAKVRPDKAAEMKKLLDERRAIDAVSPFP